MARSSAKVYTDQILRQVVMAILTLFIHYCRYYVIMYHYNFRSKVLGSATLSSPSSGEEMYLTNIHECQIKVSLLRLYLMNKHICSGISKLIYFTEQML